MKGVNHYLKNGTEHIMVQCTQSNGMPMTGAKHTKGKQRFVTQERIVSSSQKEN